ncbi:uncharacterized protein L3040_006978 [Drepanopeziza brunnea f. sp. 'multigermtubi']|uniref:Genetic interactor of prohibitins 3, mitochondrial n=1 Tax=Marssonina brunnea f. sp. multigermtubi (strain MB_m1) TaxID=1072389 RepID=K1XK60_MARBU|nr:uncharacterized protein MBM_09053 [Drepanopeziza brunnea f. sp. 'multigermtubi' MB_m1]EKD12824.1 hypothetical protein MBM_09053 [Drepanopeziza brunnea f. sp. 'multigermtubi' MB_m1]KAJ5038109.1 hypothetical protein L3040_006978 [Drepanopeziza brunnea f. sp. 'multigermtubi']
MATTIQITRRIIGKAGIPVAEIPTFLCPGILRTASLPIRCLHPQPRTFTPASQRRNISLGEGRGEKDQTQAKAALDDESASFRASAGDGTESTSISPAAAQAIQLKRLPQQCSGCGALSQTVDKQGPGFFNLQRKAVKKYLQGTPNAGLSAEGQIVKEALERAASEGLAIDVGTVEVPATITQIPVCERCNNLIHHNYGVSIQHPSMQSIRETIAKSPYKYNHVYHVLDAVDFPMSLIPGLHKMLLLAPQRSLNRRSKTGTFSKGKKTQVSFIIARSDLLAPLKLQVDAMMPYLRSVLRDALGRAGRDIRLGNVHCVSAKRDWWTKELKEDIWRRGGGGWMVGKVNVGKSQLFHGVFPKGRKQNRFLKKAVLTSTSPLDVSPRKHETQEQVNEAIKEAIEETRKAIEDTKEEMAEAQEAVEERDRKALQETGKANENENFEDAQNSIEECKSKTPGLLDIVPGADSELQAAFDEFEELDTSLDTSSLLPPAQPETDYPTMPLVSPLPGTTASPIRHSFGNGKGELIDLPGLARSDLELYVQPEHRHKLVMRERVKPEQKVIRPGQSLLLGGFIRITPTTPDLFIMAYAFTPIDAHLTSTEKAIGTQQQTRDSNVQNIALPGTGDKIASAGKFYLRWDVTRQRAGPITARNAVGIKPEQLPYRVMATDILLEGCGWVELVCQIRKRPGESFVMPSREHNQAWEREPYSDADADPATLKEYVDPTWPAVEIFTPGGEFVGARKPMNAWLLCATKPSKRALKGRPRKSMKGAKKAEKARSRAGSPV